MGPPDTVVVYGVDHSPWVQGVLLALHHHGVPHRLTSVPFGPGWVLRQGLVFPAVRMGAGPVMGDSFAIYAALEEAGHPLGVARWSPAERFELQAELERLFARYVLARCTRGRRWAFFVAWSTMRESPPSRAGAAVRGVLSVYFWVLIRLGIRVRTARGLPAVDASAVERLLGDWDARLEDTAWLTGPEPGFLDFALLGHLQCMGSGLTDEWLDTVRGFPNLCAWLRRILERAPQLPADPARRVLDPALPLSSAPAAERVWFWVSWACAVAAFPATLVLVLGALGVRSRNPGHSGAVVARARQRRGDAPAVSPSAPTR